jgi:hypothetical protein
MQLQHSKVSTIRNKTSNLHCSMEMFNKPAEMLLAARSPSLAAGPT